MTVSLSAEDIRFYDAMEHLEQWFNLNFQTLLRTFLEILLIYAGFFLPVIPALAAVYLSDAAAKTHFHIFNTSLVESTFTTTSSWLYTHREEGASI